MCLCVPLPRNCWGIWDHFAVRLSVYLPFNLCQELYEITLLSDCLCNLPFNLCQELYEITLLSDCLCRSSSIYVRSFMRSPYCQTVCVPTFRFVSRALWDHLTVRLCVSLIFSFGQELYEITLLSDCLCTYPSICVKSFMKSPYCQTVCVAHLQFRPGAYEITLLSDCVSHLQFVSGGLWDHLHVCLYLCVLSVFRFLCGPFHIKRSVSRNFLLWICNFTLHDVK
jgi:hypothetical protein